jgi:ribosome-associated toxin RatA of RatAB toxin-antitoxin module
MHTVEKKILLPYSTHQMFDLVQDVESYPQFLPWCSGVEVYQKHTDSLDAKIHINFKGIQQFFQTRNTHQSIAQKKIIDMKFVDGPFRHFEGFWQFIELDEKACRVEFKLNYQFDSKILEVIIGPVFQYIAKTFVDRFVDRARVIYG